MRKMVLSLTIGLVVSLFASEEFENKHLKCTLTEKEGETISERQAESLNEFKVDVLISKTDLKIGYKTFKYKNTDSTGDDIYSYRDDNAYYIDYSNTLHIKKTITYDEYKCTEATFMEKAKYKYDKF